MFVIGLSQGTSYPLAARPAFQGASFIAGNDLPLSREQRAKSSE